METKAVDSYIEEFTTNLQQLDQAERDDVVEFYREYIIDAGLDTDQAIHAKLGTPKHLARKILADYSIKMSENNYQQIDNGSITTNEKMKKNIGMIVLIILALFASPILVPVAIVLIGVAAIFVISAVAFTLFVVFMLALSVVIGIGMIVGGIAVIFQSFTTTIFYVGVGLAILGLDCLLIPLIIAFCKWIFDVMVMFFRWVGKKLLHGRNTPQKEDKSNA
ncbi:DUF1700 domain-containing protein [Companilactobacillus zhongbaensis]|uniref:DUF1700 domain-containing protein n=1 Tax=Companilactobacillus zhongbaensis TaxID=2486009 RepID=UPI000F78B4F6|nr:DUF1700 domain-containing protein [Companilactobacillus zhongbaensis]